MAAQQKHSIVAQLLETDSTLGIVAGLTALAVVGQNDEDEGDDYEDGDGMGLSDPHPNGGSTDKKTGRQQHGKPPSRAGGLATAISSPNTKLSATAKKYSVREQRDVIRKLQERNQILKQELSIESRDAKQLLAHEKRQRVEYLQKMTETFTAKVEMAKQTVAKLDEQIAKKEHELEMLRQQQSYSTSNGDGGGGQASGEASGGGGGGSTGGETSAAITRRVRSLENRLELSLVKRNEMDSINKHFRWQIDKIRKDRVVFDGIYKKLEKELSDCQSRFEASLAELKKATDAKEQVSLEIQQIQDHAEAEQRQYEIEFKELRLAIETAMRDVKDANDRLGGVGAVGVFGEREEPVGKTHPRGGGAVGGVIAGPSAAPPSPQATSTVAKLDSPLKRLAVLSSWKIGFDKALTTTSDSIVSKYDQIFDGIKKATGIHDITKIAEAITHKDEENFKRFRHVEELHREEAALKQQAEELAQAIEEFKAKEGIATGATQKQQYRTLEAKHVLVLEKNKAFDVEYEETTNKLTRIKSSVHSIHTMLAHANCARNADQFSIHGNTNLALGSHSARDITDSNVLEYLQVIEIFTSSLMKENHEISTALDVGTADGYLAGHDADPLAAASSPIGRGPSTLSSDPAQKLRVQVPTFGGLNGMIILPPETVPMLALYTHGRRSATAVIQQQQHKKTARLELQSQSQAAALAIDSGATPPSPGSTRPLPAASASFIGSADDTRSVGSTSTPTPAPSSVSEAADSVEGEEDERAYTYEELRSFAAKHIVKKHEDPMKRLLGHANGLGNWAPAGTAGTTAGSPSKE